MRTSTLLRGTGRLALGGTLVWLLAGAAAAGSGPETGYRVSGPYTHDNLTVFLVHGREQPPGRTFLTLQEALEKKVVLVHETRQVNELAIENVSADAEVFVQSGDIVKGGQQDRLIASDLIVPPRSGKLAVMCFCVEAERWRQRGHEAVAQFGSSSRQLPSRRLKFAGGNLGQFGNLGGQGGFQGGLIGQLGNLGGQVGIDVVSLCNLGGQFGGQLGFGQLGNLGGQLGFTGLGGGFGGQFGAGFGGQFGGAGQIGNLGVAMGVPATAGIAPAFGRSGQGGQLGMQGGVWFEVASVQQKLARNLAGDVTAAASRSSLQLTLENDKLERAVGGYLHTLTPAVDDRTDVVGYVFAINGQLNSAEVYASSALFRKLWPKLLHANAVEAVAEKRGKPFDPVGVEAVNSFLDQAARGKESVRDVTKRTRLAVRENDLALFVEARDADRHDAWIHRSYLAKERPTVVPFRSPFDD